jgi:hypothetical protein
VNRRRLAVWVAASAALAAARLEAQVPGLSNGQIILGIRRLVALLHDAETQVALPISAAYPLDLQWVAGHLYLIAVPPPDRRLLGAQLTAVDGHPVRQVLALPRPEIDYQDPGLLGVHEKGDLVNPYLLNWLGVTGSVRTAAYTVRTIRGATVTVRLTAAPADSLPWVLALERAGRAAATSHVQVTYDPMERLQLTADGSANLAHVPLPLYEQNLMRPYWMRVLPAGNAVQRVRGGQRVPAPGGEGAGAAPQAPGLPADRRPAEQPRR